MKSCRAITLIETLFPGKSMVKLERGILKLNFRQRKAYFQFKRYQNIFFRQMFFRI